MVATLAVFIPVVMTPTPTPTPTSASSWWAELGEAWLGGVDLNVTSLGGEACRDHCSMAWRAVDTAVGLAASFLPMWVGWDCVREEAERSRSGRRKEGASPPPPPPSQGRMRLLSLLCLVFGVEVGYKLASRSLVHLLFPCHAVTVVGSRREPPTDAEGCP